jgi:hypothetical protein
VQEHIFYKIHEIWTLQLYEEYKVICFQYGLTQKLKMPTINVRVQMKNWGFWDPQRRCISISDQLVKKYSWSIVLQVLKHEMAHQIVSEIFLLNDNHGCEFQKACKMLGLDEQFCKASIPIDENFAHWKFLKEETQEHQLIKKIEKLLNLAQSSNENEAALAMQKVQQLYKKYNIEKIKMGHYQNFYCLTLNFKKKIIPTTHAIAANILLNHFFVKVIFSNLYDALENTTHQTIDIFGTKENLLMAEYVFYFLIERIEILWKNYSLQNKLGFKYKRSYQQGILTGFYNKLNAAKKLDSHESDCETKSLIRLADIELNNYVKNKYPKVGIRGNSSGGVYTEHYQKGINDGNKINLNKPIAKNKSSGEILFLN